jgi:purine-nucleoside phosphorylase
MVTNLKDQIARAAAVVRAHTRKRPTVGIILGTGLGPVAKAIKKKIVIDCSEIPGFPQATVKDHAGELVIGELAGKTVAALSGRFHYYEGYTMPEITLPVRVLKAIGCKSLIVSGAVGGMNPQYSKGDLVVIEDQINLMGDNPLIGPNDEKLGPRYPDMIEPFDKKLIDMALKAAVDLKVRAHTGVYVGVSGPNLETRAEYRFLRIIGADVVGMSVVPEVLVAIHSGMKVLGLVVVTDMCLPDALQPAKIEDIIAIANGAEPKMTGIVKKVIAGM